MTDPEFQKRLDLMYRFYLETPEQGRGDSYDHYKRGLVGIMRPEGGTLADAAWRAGRDTTKAGTKRSVGHDEPSDGNARAS